MALYTKELVRWIAGRPFKIEVTVLRRPPEPQRYSAAFRIEGGRMVRLEGPPMTLDEAIEHFARRIIEREEARKWRVISYVGIDDENLNTVATMKWLPLPLYLPDQQRSPPRRRKKRQLVKVGDGGQQ